MKKWKTIIALILALTIFLSVGCISVLAATDGTFNPASNNPAPSNSNFNSASSNSNFNSAPSNSNQYYDDDEDEDEEDDDFFEVVCPSCGETIYFDEDMLDNPDGLICPNCNEPIEINIADKPEED